MKNNTSFYRKQHVVLWKTIRRFTKNNTSFLEGIFCSIGKFLKLGIRYERLKNRDHQRFAQKRGADCSYSTQKCLKLYYQPFGWNGGLCFLRYKTFYQYGV